MLLITSANGNQGKLLVPKLARSGFEIKACVRSEASAQAVRAAGASEVVVGDIGEPAIITEAMRAIDQVYHIGPTGDPRERQMGLALIDAAATAGVKQFVFSSVLHAITTDLIQHEIKRDIEEHLLSSGLEFTILQPSNYMLPLKLRPAFEDGVFRLSWALDRRQSLVDLGDVTDVAARVLSDCARHSAATYELAGAGRHTAHELAGIIGAVIGRVVTAEEIGPETYLESWIGKRDASEVGHQIRIFRAISARYSSHDFIGNPNVLTWLLGRPPTTFEGFVRAQYTAYRRDRPSTN